MRYLCSLLLDGEKSTFIGSYDESWGMGGKGCDVKG